MLARFSLISIFSNASTLIQRIGLSLLLLFFSCEEANYQLDNVSDPWNMDLEPPALFFHPSEIETFINTIFHLFFVSFLSMNIILLFEARHL